MKFIKLSDCEEKEKGLKDKPVRVITQEMGCTQKSWKIARVISLGIVDLVARKDMKNRGKKLDLLEPEFKHRVVFSYRGSNY